MKPLVLLSLLATPLMAQQLTEGISQTYEVQYSASPGVTPLWLNANRYGLSSLKGSNGYIRGRVERPMADDSSRSWDLGYGADVAVPMGYTSHVVLQQLYAEARYKHGVLTLGQKEQPMALQDARLSSGAQTLGINARPVPGIRLEVPQYYDIPGLKGWLGLKGHCFYGWMTDGAWQEEWTQETSHYARGVMLHTKAGYLRIGRERKKPHFDVTLELGLEMACQFGGTMYHTSSGTVKGASGLKAWLNAFTAGGDDEVNATYHNVGGNQLGSWVMRLRLADEDFTAAFYLDHFFEDHSSMFFLDYDGYGSGPQWNERVDSRYLGYPMNDAMVGLDVKLTHFRWLDHIVLEYLNTRYQSGPIYHDHDATLSDHIGGNDSYYNHYLYQGWSHWGQVMGNPLYRSPLYNTDRTLTIQDNRFQAIHLGLDGSCEPAQGHLIDYRLLLTFQKGLGTYSGPFFYPERTFSTMAEATWSPAVTGMLGHCSFRMAVGLDQGKLLGDNFGIQTSVIVKI